MHGNVKCQGDIGGAEKVSTIGKKGVKKFKSIFNHPGRNKSTNLY